MGKLSADWAPKCLNADQKVNGASRLSKGGIFLVRSKWFPVAIGDHGRNLVISLWPGDKATSNWVAALRLTPPQTFRVQNSLEIFSPRFLESRRHPTRLLSSKGPNYKYGVLVIPSGAIEGHFEGENLREIHQVCLVLSRQFPVSPDTCNPEETGQPGLPFSWSPPYYPVLAPSDYHLFPGRKKTESSNFSSDADFVATAETCCTDKFLNFCEWLARVRATVSEVYWA